MNVDLSLLNDHMTQRGAELAERGHYLLRAGALTTVIAGPSAQMLQPAGLAPVIAALVQAADFAMAANTIAESTRLTQTAKAADIGALADAAGANIHALLTATGDALVAAELVAAKEALPTPVEAADAAQSVIDGELRGLLRPLALPEQMRLVEREFSILQAVLRLPVAFTAPLVEFATARWATLNPNGQSATLAAGTAASWREARSVVAGAHAAVSKLARRSLRVAA